MLITRDEHLAWCKQRALEYLDRNDVTNAVASMMSDMNKHPGTALDANSVLLAMGLAAAISGDSSFARRYIEGFN